MLVETTLERGAVQTKSVDAEAFELQSKKRATIQYFSKPDIENWGVCRLNGQRDWACVHIDKMGDLNTYEILNQEELNKNNLIGEQRYAAQEATNHEILESLKIAVRSYLNHKSTKIKTSETETYADPETWVVARANSRSKWFCLREQTAQSWNCGLLLDDSDINQWDQTFQKQQETSIVDNADTI